MPERVILAAVDGLDWKRVRSGIDAGRLPNLAAMLREGAHAEMAVRPVVPGLVWPETDINSPTLWTTIATGQYYFQHGIYDFRDIAESAENPPLFESRHVRSPRIWDVLSQYERSSLVVGYYVTHPAYPIRGAMISDLFGEVESTDAATPVDLHEEMARLLGAPDYAAYVRTGERIGSEARVLADSDGPRAADEARYRETVRSILAEFTALAPDEIETLLTAPELATALRLIEFRLIYPAIRDDRFHRIFVHLLDREQWDFATVYYRLLDFASHGFWCEGADLDTDFGRRYGPVVDRAYARLDAWIGEIRQRMSPGDRLLVLSDHGFMACNRPGEYAHPAFAPDVVLGEHAEPAVLLLEGGARSGTVPEVGLLDLAPTILDFFGIPQADSLDGGPVPGLLAPAAPAALPRVEAYPYVAPSASAGLRQNEEQSILSRLAALGYIE